MRIQKTDAVEKLVQGTIKSASTYGDLHALVSSIEIRDGAEWISVEKWLNLAVCIELALMLLRRNSAFLAYQSEIRFG